MRAVDTVSVRQRFLIVCEGEKTEPLYFKQFRVPGLVLEVKGTGMNTISLVVEALRLRNEEEYDQVWCVFDKDDFERFDEAIQLARSEGMKVAYSNQAFELWYVLHFCYMQNALDRKTYKKMLGRKEFLGFKYEKNNPQMYALLLPKVNSAIKNAQKLLKGYKTPKCSVNDPSTTIHELVMELLEHAKPISERLR
jgi:hypothetical protein